METIGCNIKCLVFVEEIVRPYVAVMVSASIKQNVSGNSALICVVSPNNTAVHRRG